MYRLTELVKNDWRQRKSVDQHISGAKMSHVQGAYPQKLGVYSYDLSMWTPVLLDLSESMEGTQ